MSTAKWFGRENWTKNTFCVGPVEPTDKENEVKMYKKYCFRYVHYLFKTVGIRTHIKQSDPDPYQIGKQDPDTYQSEKQDPDPYQSEKQDPDPYQKCLDPQHCP